ncbi:serine/threonine-protein kinase pim-1-like [Anabas testudineus]|uniref:serine/threonine-protein kinase pim-1-like n=1 Tax=Anabas testudineus TaxID=64144 RepID=UPI000E4580CD|nr:serine/threonine-protein kinase pim-1-like [Anabas testudineus]
MDKASSARSIETCNSAGIRRDYVCSTSQHTSALPKNDGRTRSAKRKAGPEKNTVQKKGKVSEVPEPREKDRVTSCSKSVNSVSKGSSKRKASTYGEGPSRKKERSRDQKEDLSVSEFKAKYTQQNQLGKGGCGCVFAGYRNADNLPVAIKHIPKDKVFCKVVDRNGRELSAEVAVMLKLAGGKAGSVGASVPVSLLDWHDLDQELILVLERPVPSEDLFNYIEINGGSLQEEEAKIILKQLVDAAVELHNKCIFHRDIKVENILIQTGADVPRVRLIDFGLSCFFKKTSSYRVFYGTLAHVPPEWYSCYSYKAGPTTVWQLGVVLFEMLHPEESFETTKFLGDKLEISNQLSLSCQDFLQMCLTKVPEQRPTLEQLHLHPWLR